MTSGEVNRATFDGDDCSAKKKKKAGKGILRLGRGFPGLKKAIRGRLTEDFDQDLKDVKGAGFLSAE